MNRYIIRSLLVSVLTIWAISLIIYLILSLAPNDPLSQFGANPSITPEVRENMRKSLGLDQPPVIRYWYWFTAMLQGNMGQSFASRVPVSELLMQRLPTSLGVLGTAYLISVLFAIPIGIISAIKQYSMFDHVVSAFAFIGFSVPTFFTGVIFIMIFSIKLRWLPMMYNSTLVISDFDTLIKAFKQSIMPIMVLGLFQTASLARYTRASMLENLPQDYVRTARAKGLRERFVIMRHAFRNSMIPVVTLVALGVPGVFGGALITEQVFVVPGIGSLLIKALETSDIPVIMGVTFIYGVLVVIFNFIADLVYGFLDPRIKLS